MQLPSSGLNYGALLALPDQEAVFGAVQTAMAFDLKSALARLKLMLGEPQVRDPLFPTSTRVMLLPIAVTAPPPEDFIDYSRLDLGDYMACCQRYIANSNAPTPESIAAWLLSEHKLWFDPADLTVTVGSTDPTDPLAIQWTVNVLPGNYVWIGKVTLLAVAGNHLALYVRPGTARGLIFEDVGLPSTG